MITVLIYTRASDILAGLTSLRAEDSFYNLSQFYEFLWNPVMTVFQPNFKQQDEAAYPEFGLVLSKKMANSHVCID